MGLGTTKVYSQVAVLGRAIDIADECAQVWGEQWMVVRAAREFHVVPRDPTWTVSDGVIVYVAL